MVKKPIKKFETTASQQCHKNRSKQAHAHFTITYHDIGRHIVRQTQNIAVTHRDLVDIANAVFVDETVLQSAHFSGTHRLARLMENITRKDM